jgi:hypothetical protein
LFFYLIGRMCVGRRGCFSLTAAASSWCGGVVPVLVLQGW